MQGILLRVGIDQSFGGYNAPVDPDSGDFVYLPIPEERDQFNPAYLTEYNEFIEPLEDFSQRHELKQRLALPDSLSGQGCHLDPDFSTLTYGDHNNQKGRKIKGLSKGDFIAFYAGLKPIKPHSQKLVYALIGIYFVDYNIEASEVGPNQRYLNAHTRIKEPAPNDVVVFADRRNSGRFNRCLPIGTYRNGAYRVTPDLLEKWGGLDIKDGFIQRSVNPPSFTNPDRFLSWLESMNVSVFSSNNP